MVKKTALRKRTQLEGFIFNQCQPEKVPQKVATPQDDNDLLILKLMIPLLALKDVTRDVCLRVFKLYSSVINGSIFQAGRLKFLVRRKFQRINEKSTLRA